MICYYCKRHLTQKQVRWLFPKGVACKQCRNIRVGKLLIKELNKKGIDGYNEIKK